jgi:hypothetical protein
LANDNANKICNCIIGQAQSRSSEDVRLQLLSILESRDYLTPSMSSATDDDDDDDDDGSNVLSSLYSSNLQNSFRKMRSKNTVKSIRQSGGYDKHNYLIRVKVIGGDGVSKRLTIRCDEGTQTVKWLALAGTMLCGDPVLKASSVPHFVGSGTAHRISDF